MSQIYSLDTPRLSPLQKVLLESLPSYKNEETEVISFLYDNVLHIEFEVDGKTNTYCWLNNGWTKTPTF